MSNKYLQEFLTLTNLPELHYWKIPHIQISADKTGPTVFLTSGIHGDELAGNFILDKFCNFLKEFPLERGKIVALVGVNQGGAESSMREIPESGEDLNRFFGSESKNTIAERLSDNICLEIFKHRPSLVVDIHNDNIFSVPYVLLDARETFSEEVYTITKEIALVCGLPVVQERDDEGKIYRNTLSAYFVSQKIPAITIESGPDKILENKHVEDVFKGLINILVNQKMLPLNVLGDKKIENSDKLEYDRILEYGLPVVVNVSGDVTYLKAPGSSVQIGDLLAEVVDNFGGIVERIICPYNAYILGHSEKINIVKGDEIYWLAQKN